MKLNIKINKSILPWLVFHFLILVLFTVSIIRNSGIKVDSDLFSFLPNAFDSKALTIADERITAKSSENVIILVSSEKFEDAKKMAFTVYDELLKTGKFDSITLESESTNSTEIISFISNHRNYILPEDTIKELETEDGCSAFAERSLMKAYSAFTFSSMETLLDDPFMLDEVNMENYFSMIKASGTAMSPKEGVLASFYEGKWYVMINGVLNKKAAALASKENGVNSIYEICSKYENDNIRFVYSGTPFHSNESSSNASKEIMIISIASLTAVLVILLFVFRSPLPIVYTFLTIFLSMGSAFALTHTVFRGMHVLSLVFGTSLIGSCIDYSLHFFVNWKGNGKLKTGNAVKSHLIRGLVFSLASTEICYVLLSFAPFALLKQMAVFSLTGILSSFLSVVCIYPLCKVPEEKKRKLAFVTENDKPRGRIGFVLSMVILGSSLLAILIFHNNFKMENGINNLYVMQGRLKEDSILSTKVLNYSPSSWFIVSGDSIEQVLEREEDFSSKIPVPYISVSRFIPSEKMQQASFSSVKKLSALSYSQMEALGFEKEDADYYLEGLVQNTSDMLSIDSDLPSGLETLRRNLWIGEINGKYYSIMIPVSVVSNSLYKELAETSEGIYYENKVLAINEGLDKLSTIILVMFAVSYVIIFVMMAFFYEWKKVFRIMSVPLLSTATIFAYHAISGIPMEFFSITGLILVFGLGLDYIIYSVENKSSKLERYAIVLSFITTAISFGALAFSSFVPVHTLGLSIFIGLTAAFLSVI